MNIDSDDRTQAVRLEVLETEDAHLPSVKVAVDAQFCGFVGSSSVWFERAALDEMVNAVEMLEATRTGEAKLESMGAGAFALSISSLDAAGHLLVTASLTERTHVRKKVVERRVSGAFEIDPSGLPDLVAGLRAIAAARGIS